VEITASFLEKLEQRKQIMSPRFTAVSAWTVSISHKIPSTSI